MQLIEGQVTIRQRFRRGEIVSFFSSLAPCLVGIEACATAHHWAREIRRFGHDVKLIPRAYVKPYVRRGAKNDAADAAAICEAEDDKSAACSRQLRRASSPFWIR
jgi:transposase